MGFNSLNVSFFDLEPPAQTNDIKFGGISKKTLSFVNYLYHLFVFIILGLRRNGAGISRE